MVPQLLLLLLLVHRGTRCMAPSARGTMQVTRNPVQDVRCPVRLFLPVHRTSELRNKRPRLFRLVRATRLRGAPDLVASVA